MGRRAWTVGTWETWPFRGARHWKSSSSDALPAAGRQPSGLSSFPRTEATLRRGASWPGLRCGGGKRSGHSVALAQHPVPETFVHHLVGPQPQLRKWSRRPPLVIIQLRVVVLTLRTGELGHQQPATDLQERCRTLGHHRRPPEGTGQRPVEARLGSQAHARRPLLSPPRRRPGCCRSESLDRPTQEGGPTSVGLQELQASRRATPMATTRPGSPPPEPRSDQTVQTREGRGVDPMAAKPSACWTCGSSGPGPRNPRPRASRRGLEQESGGVSPFFGAGHRRLVSLLAR